MSPCQTCSNNQPCPAKEINGKMQTALLHRLPPTAHLFTDIMEIFGEGPTWHRRFMDQPEYEDKLNLLWNVAPRQTHGYCLQHDMMCPFQTGASGRVGGTPCQDFSSSGLRKQLAGPQLPPLLAFGAKSSSLMTPAAGLECVKELPGYVVMDAFGPDYSWPLAVHMTPSDVGFHCINRTRKGFNLK